MLKSVKVFFGEEHLGTLIGTKVEEEGFWRIEISSLNSFGNKTKNNYGNLLTLFVYDFEGLDWVACDVITENIKKDLAISEQAKKYKQEIDICIKKAIIEIYDNFYSDTNDFIKFKF
jgi:hypothetical protein